MRHVVLGGVLLFTTLASPFVYGMTVSDLAKLTGQEYVNAREQLIAQKGLTKFNPENSRERVAWQAIQIWRNHEKLHSQLVFIERSGPGADWGRAKTASASWRSLALFGGKSRTDDFFILAEALLFKTLQDWNPLEWENCCGALAGFAVDAQDVQVDEKSQIIVDAIKTV